MIMYIVHEPPKGLGFAGKIVGSPEEISAVRSYIREHLPDIDIVDRVTYKVHCQEIERQVLKKRA